MDIFDSKSTQILTACAIPFISASIIGYGTQKSMYPWYTNLKKPSFCPPGWVFPVVWTYLYSTMGYASFRVWEIGNGFEGAAKMPLILYIIQLLVNVTWPQTFFKLHLIKAGAIHIIVLWISIILTTISFSGVDNLAAALLLPYAAWVTLATFINISLVRLNPTDVEKKD